MGLRDRACRLRPGASGREGMSDPAGGAVEARDAFERHVMARALQLAARGWGRVAPNPMVGAVLCRGREVVGEGFHEACGADHAEVMALRAAGDLAPEATMFVNLEPCAHHGNTPPCTDALIRAGVRAVVFSVRDPHREAGGGAESLRRAGIEVREGVLAEAARRLNAPFLWRQLAGAPFVGLKLAVSLDSRLSATAGEPTRVTGEESLQYVQWLRAGYDAVLVGSGTARADDPLLTVRDGAAVGRPPLRVVVDTELGLDRGSRLVQSLDRAPLLVACGEDAPSDRAEALRRLGIEVLAVPRGEGGGVDLGAVLRGLGARGIGSVLVEGGGLVASALLRGRLVQRLHLIIAPGFLGDGGTPAFPGLTAQAGGDWSVTDRVALEEDTCLQLESEDMLRRLSGETV